MLIQHLFQGECHLFKRSEFAYIVAHQREKHNWRIYTSYLNHATFQYGEKILLKLLQGEAIEVEDGRFINILYTNILAC